MAPWIRRVWWAKWFSKDVGVLVPGICDCPTLPGKREFADEIHLETGRWSRIIRAGRPNAITRSS